MVGAGGIDIEAVGDFVLEGGAVPEVARIVGRMDVLPVAGGSIVTNDKITTTDPILRFLNESTTGIGNFCYILQFDGVDAGTIVTNLEGDRVLSSA